MRAERVDHAHLRAAPWLVLRICDQPTTPDGVRAAIGAHERATDVAIASTFGYHETIAPFNG
jgi:hypothetical protein